MSLVEDVFLTAARRLVFFALLIVGLLLVVTDMPLIEMPKSTQVRLPNGFRPQWGRSVNLPVPFPSQTQQLVRLQFPEPRDITIYLQGFTHGAGATATRYKVQAGIGGIQLYESIIPTPVVGSVQHWAADAITVEALISGQNSPAGGVYRVAAAAGLGRPTHTFEVVGRASDLAGVPNPYAQVGDFGIINMSSHAWVRVPQWAVAVKVEVLDWGTVAINPNNLWVAQVRTSGTVSNLAYAAAYADDFVPLDTYCWWIHVQYSTAETIPIVVTFKKHS